MSSNDNIESTSPKRTAVNWYLSANPKWNIWRSIPLINENNVYRLEAEVHFINTSQDERSDTAICNWMWKKSKIKETGIMYTHCVDVAKSYYLWLILGIETFEGGICMTFYLLRIEIWYFVNQVHLAKVLFL